MSAERRNHHFRKHGLYEGYTEYRYGSLPARAPKHKRILTAAQGAAAIEGATRILGNWTFSKFEHEAHCRHGIRQGLCLAGHPWDASDSAAVYIVAEALANLGAQRPSWAEGQHEYVTPRENCRRCGRDLEADAYTGKRRTTYCSVECARADIEAIEDGNRKATNVVYARAQRLVRRARTKPRLCPECGSTFQPRNESSAQVFCSHSCRAKGFRRKALSNSYEFTCVICGSHYVHRDKRSRYCSPSCKSAGGRMSIGRWPPIKISALAFDYAIMRPLISARSLLPSHNLK